MSETASFVDPVFLARFGLSRLNAIDYFLHPLNPFRTKLNTSNEVLAMQGTGIGTLMQFGTDGIPLSPQAAEEEYATALTRLNGEQYELLPPTPPTPNSYVTPSPLFTIRHVVRTNPTTAKVLGIYYILEGVIYKAPSLRALMKAHVARTLQGLSDACGALSACARYQPSTGYIWVFESSGKDDAKKKTKFDHCAEDDHDEEDDDDDDDPVALLQLAKSRKRRKVLDHRVAGERTVAEEEGIRASEAMDRILLRLAKSDLIVSKQTQGIAATATTTPATKAHKIALKKVVQ